MSVTFRHSGDLGDIIYSLPAVRALGGGTLYLNAFSPPLPGLEKLKFNKECAVFLSPLLEAQEYINELRIADISAPDYNLDMIRHYIGISPLTRSIDWKNENLNLSDIYLKIFNLPEKERNRKWLSVKRTPLSEFVFHRSLRAHNQNFPWKKIVSEFAQRAIFIGLENEWKSFQEEFGKVEFHRVDNALEMAEIIAGAGLFIGNQSLPSAIAEGLKQNAVLEAMPYMPNGQFQRANLINPLTWDDDSIASMIKGTSKN